MPKVIEKEQVYRAVIEVLLERGYDGATTKELAQAAGIHEATLFRKFGSKYKLIEEAIRAQFTDVPLASVTYTGDLHADLLAVVEAYLETQAMVGDVLPILLVEIRRNPELRASLEVPWNNISRISGILERYQTEGVLKKVPLLTSINVLLGPLMVSRMVAQADLDLHPPEIVPQDYVDNFLSGLLV